jgi:outer membrane protein OmpA-like peptidoglycan-associated protein
MLNSWVCAINIYMAEFQVGFGAAKAAAQPIAQAPKEIKSESTPASAPSVRMVDRAGGRSPIATFSVAQAAIKPADKVYLEKLSKALADNKQLFDKVSVHGFADVSGSSNLNQQLSALRAENVRKEILNLSRLESEKIGAIGEGATNSTKVISADRRVELEFTGVKDEAKLREAISKIR